MSLKQRKIIFKTKDEIEPQQIYLEKFNAWGLELGLLSFGCQNVFDLVFYSLLS